MQRHPFDETYTAYLQKRARRSRFRSAVRSLYLRRQANYAIGPTIDFGCGLGALLPFLPPGSLGLDVNASSVACCHAAGLPAQVYDPETDRYELREFEPGRFESLVAAHVFEHFEEPLPALNQLLRSCERLAIGRVVVVVPGRAGFEVDPTHRTFLTPADLTALAVVTGTGFRSVVQRYYPLNFAALGDWFPYLELHTVYGTGERSPGAAESRRERPGRSAA